MDPSSKRPTIRGFLSSNAAGWVVPALFILVWQGAARAGLLPENVLPAPSDVLRRGMAAHNERRAARQHRRQRTARRHRLRHRRQPRLRASASLNGVSRIGEKLTDTTFQMIRNIPNLAMIPLVILWFGIARKRKLFLVALGVFFPIYINTLPRHPNASTRSWSRWAASYGMSRCELFRRVILPGALPSIFVGLRYALGIMWLTLIVAETIAASPASATWRCRPASSCRSTSSCCRSCSTRCSASWPTASRALLERLTLQWHPAFQARNED